MKNVKDLTATIWSVVIFITGFVYAVVLGFTLVYILFEFLRLLATL